MAYSVQIQLQYLLYGAGGFVIGVFITFVIYAVMLKRKEQPKVSRACLCTGDSLSVVRRCFRVSHVALALSLKSS